MGGVPKGLLRRAGSTTPIIVELANLARDLGLPVVLVGWAEAYASVLPDAPVLEDDPPGTGPLGGLAALLACAGPRAAIAVACDMPHVSSRSIEMLLSTSPGASIVAPRDPTGGRWEPFLAKYDSPRVLPVLRQAQEAGIRSLQRVFESIDVRPLPAEAWSAGETTDWDSPSDVAADGGHFPELP